MRAKTRRSTAAASAAGGTAAGVNVDDAIGSVACRIIQKSHRGTEAQSLRFDSHEADQADACLSVSYVCGSTPWHPSVLRGLENASACADYTDSKGPGTPISLNDGKLYSAVTKTNRRAREGAEIAEAIAAPGRRPLAAWALSLSAIPAMGFWQRSRTSNRSAFQVGIRAVLKVARGFHLRQGYGGQAGRGALRVPRIVIE